MPFPCLCLLFGKQQKGFKTSVRQKGPKGKQVENVTSHCFAPGARHGLRERSNCEPHYQRSPASPSRSRLAWLSPPSPVDLSLQLHCSLPSRSRSRSAPAPHPLCSVCLSALQPRSNFTPFCLYSASLPATGFPAPFHRPAWAHSCLSSWFPRWPSAHHSFPLCP